MKCVFLLCVARRAPTPPYGAPIIGSPNLGSNPTPPIPRSPHNRGWDRTPPSPRSPHNRGWDGPPPHYGMGQEIDVFRPTQKGLADPLPDVNLGVRCPMKSQNILSGQQTPPRPNLSQNAPSQRHSVFAQHHMVDSGPHGLPIRPNCFPPNTLEKIQTHSCDAWHTQKDTLVGEAYGVASVRRGGPK